MKQPKTSIYYALFHSMANYEIYCKIFKTEYLSRIRWVQAFFPKVPRIYQLHYESTVLIISISILIDSNVSNIMFQYGYPYLQNL